MISIFQVVLVGGIVGFAMNIWVTFGGLTVKDNHPPLPPSSIAGCHGNFSTAGFSSNHPTNWYGSDQTITMDTPASTMSTEHRSVYVQKDIQTE